MPTSELVVMQLVIRHHQHHRTPTCTDTAGEHAVVLSHERSCNKQRGRDPRQPSLTCTFNCCSIGSVVLTCSFVRWSIGSAVFTCTSSVEECRTHTRIHMLLCWQCCAHMHIHLLLYWECDAHIHIHLLLYWERRAHMHIHLLLY